MWKGIWLTLLIMGMGSFVVTSLIVAVRAIPELLDLLRQHRDLEDTTYGENSEEYEERTEMDNPGSACSD